MKTNEMETNKITEIIFSRVNEDTGLTVSFCDTENEMFCVTVEAEIGKDVTKHDYPIYMSWDAENVAKSFNAFLLKKDHIPQRFVDEFVEGLNFLKR